MIQNKFQTPVRILKIKGNKSESEISSSSPPSYSSLIDLYNWNIKSLHTHDLKGFKGENIKIAFLDTGIDSSHPILEGKIKKKKNFVSKKVFVKRIGRKNIFTEVINEDETEDGNGHGTFCAGICSSNSEQLSVAPLSELYIGKVMNDEGKGTIESIIRGLEWAIEEKVDIVNLSLGYTGFLDSKIREVLEKAIDRNIIVVCAAGNEGPKLNTISSPGIHTRCITVGAHDIKDVVAPFSSRGSQLDFVAPGVDIISCINGSGASVGAPKGAFAITSGTSMAAPYVSGCAALFLEAYNKGVINIGNSAQDERKMCELFEEWCKKGCVDLGERGFDSHYGEGKVCMRF